MCGGLTLTRVCSALLLLCCSGISEAKTPTSAPAIPSLRPRSNSGGSRDALRRSGEGAGSLPMSNLKPISIPILSLPPGSSGGPKTPRSLAAANAANGGANVSITPLAGVAGGVKAPITEEDEIALRSISAVHTSQGSSNSGGGMDLSIAIPSPAPAISLLPIPIAHVEPHTPPLPQLPVLGRGPSSGDSGSGSARGSARSFRSASDDKDHSPYPASADRSSWVHPGGTH